MSDLETMLRSSSRKVRGVAEDERPEQRSSSGEAFVAKNHDVSWDV
jgi:hypothetical protein